MQMYALLYMSETLLAWHFNDVYPFLDLRLLLSTKYVYGGSFFLHVFFLHSALVYKAAIVLCNLQLECTVPMLVQWF